MRRVSVPLFGDSFFIILSHTVTLSYTVFPSPYSGILFLLKVRMYRNYDKFPVSVPLFGDSFFILRSRKRYSLKCFGRFRPLIRGFFFYCRILLIRCQHKLFPSPYSGILFLSCRYDMPPSLNIFAIFRRILHFLAQKGFPLTQSIHFSPYPSASARIKSFFIHIVPSPIPLNQYIITSSSFISPMPHDLTLVWS